MTEAKRIKRSLLHKGIILKREKRRYGFVVAARDKKTGRLIYSKKGGSFREAHEEFRDVVRTKNTFQFSKIFKKRRDENFEDFESRSTSGIKGKSNKQVIYEDKNFFYPTRLFKSRRGVEEMREISKLDYPKFKLKRIGRIHIRKIISVG